MLSRAKGYQGEPHLGLSRELQAERVRVGFQRGSRHGLWTLMMRVWGRNSQRDVILGPREFHSK